MNAPKLCAFGDCPRLSIKRGLCSTHYSRARTNGLLAEYPRALQERIGPCTVAGCTEPKLGRGLCSRHHSRLLRTGTTADPCPPPVKVCTVEGCERKSASRGWCAMHYSRWQRNGTTETRSVVPKVLGPDSSAWVGESATYRTVHSRLTKQRGKAQDYDCVDCDAPARHWSYNGDSDREQKTAEGWRYTTDLGCYSPRCLRCHHQLDHPAAPACPQGHEMSGDNLAAHPRGRKCRACARANAVRQRLKKKRNAA